MSYFAPSTVGKHLNGAYIVVTEEPTLNLMLPGRHEGLDVPTGAKAGDGRGFIVEMVGTLSGEFSMMQVGPYVRFRWASSLASAAEEARENPDEGTIGMGGLGGGTGK